MPCHRKWLGLVLACLVGVAHADPWDDFANNLFTDLAPLLALFGERVTMQFMSQALGWEDCIVLAMGPLGIITILVSAIRVGGPAWLKAVVGRVRENVSAAEMELMSSTSKEVCELYNGQTIVRCQGSAPVWEFIYLIPTTSRKRDLNRRRDIKVITLEEACKENKKLLYTLKGDPSESESLASQYSPPQGTNKMARLYHKSKIPSFGTKQIGLSVSTNTESAVFFSPPSPRNDDVSIEQGVELEVLSEPNAEVDDSIYVIRNMSSDAPNIILNLQNSASNRKELRAYAAIGVILQLSVLIFFGIITYHSTVRNSFRKDEKRVGNYALPLAVSGTLVLVLGLFFCGTIVEGSTQKTHYRRNDKYEMRVIWIQQKQTVGDQVFEPFATFPDSPRNVITMSRRRDTPQAHAPETRAVIGISLGLVGFIIQFIGLRGMNSAATLAQLGAVGIMTAVRAWVRRGLARPPGREKQASGFELDAVAWALTNLSRPHEEGPRPEAPTENPEPELRSPDNVGEEDTRQQAKKDRQALMQPGSMAQLMSPEKQKQCSWTISTGGNVEHQPFLRYRTSSNSKAEQVLETRRNLSRLAQFKGTIAAEAINLAIAMEKVMGVIFPLKLKDSKREWTWPLAIVYTDSELVASSQYYVNLPLIGEEGSWKVLADRLESVLSLCLFTAHKQKENQPEEDQSGFDLDNENSDWLRQKTTHSGLGLRLLGSANVEKTDQLIQDLRWWAPETFDILAEIQEDATGSDGDGSTEGPAGVWNNQETSAAAWETRQELYKIFRSDLKLDSILIDDNRVVGYGPTRLRPNSNKKRHFRNFSILPESQKSRTQRGAIAIESSDSLEKLFAKDLLFSFLISAAKTLTKPLQSEVKTRGTTANSKINGTPLTMATNEMTSLASTFGSLGYGTEQEVWLAIIAPLSLAERLPFPRPLFDFVRERAERKRREHKEEDAHHEYLKLWDQAQRHTSSTESIRGRGTALLIEHLIDIREEMKLNETAAEDPCAFLEQASEEVRSRLRRSKHQPGFFAHLLAIYKKQKRPAMVELIQDLAGPARQNSFPDYFGISKLHRKIINSGGGGKSGPWRKEERTVVNKRDLLDWTPLHYAAARQNELLGYDLLKRGADPNLKDLHGFTPVHYASEHGMKSFVSLLQRFGGRLDARGLNGATPMHVAARGGHLKLIKSWSRYDQGDIQSLSRLRDHNGRVPVHWAVVYGQEKVVEELRSSLDEPDKYGWTSLHLATVHHGDRLMETVLGLSTEREKLDRKGRTALILACEKERLQAAHQLIEAGADVNAATPDGTTVLNYAIIYTGDVSLVRALVRQGARVDVPSKAFEGRTPLHSAAERGNFPIVSILVGSLNSLRREARSLAIDFGDQDGLTALHLAVQNRYPKVMTLLLSAGADPNKQDKEQQTPLHRVFTMGWERRGMCLTLVKMLIENGANPRARDQFGSMPSDIATQLRYLESAEYLRGYTGVDET